VNEAPARVLKRGNLVTRKSQIGTDSVRSVVREVTFGGSGLEANGEDRDDTETIPRRRHSLIGVRDEICDTHMLRAVHEMTANYGTLSVPGAKLCFKMRGEGPALLVIQGGAGNADAVDSLAESLATEFTTISYDRRGLMRSTLDDPSQALSVAEHAEDAHALLEELTRGPAFILSSSLGALIGLELAARWPGSVRRLIAHEPIAVHLLSSSEQQEYRALQVQIGQIALRDGPRAALRRFLAEIGVDGDDREDEVEAPLSTRQQSRDTGFLLTRESRAAERFRIDLDALGPIAGKIMPAFGSSSRDRIPARCALALARELDQDAAEFPGCHTGYVLRPRAFAERLRQVLLAPAAPSHVRIAACKGSSPNNARSSKSRCALGCDPDVCFRRVYQRTLVRTNGFFLLGQEPTEKQRARERAEQLRHDEARHVHRPDAREGVARGTRQRDCGIRERRRSREPIRRRYVSADGERRELSVFARNTPDHREQAERCDELAQELRWSAPHVP
jgi:pimeloyl-ACP methyl ester carboxylesterase